MQIKEFIPREALSLDILGKDYEKRQWLFKEVYPGVRPLEFRVKLLADIGEFDPRFLSDLYGIVARIDERFDTEDPPKAEPGQPRLFERPLTREQVAEKQREYLEMLFGFLENENVVFGHPMYGGYTIMDQLQKRGVAFDRALPLWISGSQGTETGFAVIKEKIAPQLLDPDKIVVLGDDVTDSITTLTQFALARRERRLGEIDEEFKFLIEEMQVTKKKVGKYDHPEFVPIYKNLAKLFREEHIVLAPFTNKNQPAIDSFGKEARMTYITSVNEADVQWAQMQILAAKMTLNFKQSEWLIGGQGEWAYPMLDTSVNGQKQKEDEIGLLDFINDPGIREKLIEWGLDKLYLRVGAGVKGIVVFNPDQSEEAYPELVKVIADILVDYAKHRIQEEQFQKSSGCP